MYDRIMGVRKDKTIIFDSILSLFFLLVVGFSILLLTSPYYQYAVALVPGLVVLLLLLLGHFSQPAYYLIVFLIPFAAYRGLGESLQFLSIPWAVGLYLITILFLRLVLERKTALKLKSNLWPLLLFFFVISFLSTLLSGYRITAFNDLRLLLVAYTFFTLNLVFISEKDFCKTLPKIIILSVSISSLIGIISYMHGVGTVGLEEDAEIRAYGAAIDPNNLALMILFILPLLANWFFSSRRTLGKLLVSGLFLTNMVTFILTYSRWGAIVASVVLFLLFIEHIGKFRPKHLGFVTLLFVIVFLSTIIFVPAAYWQRQKTVTDVTSKSIGRRASYVRVGWEAFKRKPILGSGSGTFREIFADSAFAAKYAPKGAERAQYRRYAHNTYIEVLVGTGILGLIMFLIILWRALRNFYLAHRQFQSYRDKEMASIVRAYQISFFVVILYLLNYSAIYHKYFLLSLALSQIALTFSRSRKTEESVENANRSE